MKKLFALIALLAIAGMTNAQTAEYGKVDGNGVYESYIPKDGNKISVGDTLVIGNPTGPTRFLYIQQGGQNIAAQMAGKKVIISKIKSYGKPKTGYTLFVQFKGYGMPVFILYDKALETGEIINPHAGITKDEALAKLKDAKEKLNLELITQADYDKLKQQLAPVIMGDK